MVLHQKGEEVGVHDRGLEFWQGRTTGNNYQSAFKYLQTNFKYIIDNGYVMNDELQLQYSVHLVDIEEADALFELESAVMDANFFTPLIEDHLKYSEQVFWHSKYFCVLYFHLNIFLLQKRRGRGPPCHVNLYIGGTTTMSFTVVPFLEY